MGTSPPPAPVVPEKVHNWLTEAQYAQFRAAARNMQRLSKRKSKVKRSFFDEYRHVANGTLVGLEVRLGDGMTGTVKSLTYFASKKKKTCMPRSGRTGNVRTRSG